MKRVLVTGATGLVGGAVLRRLLREGYAVVMATSTAGVESRHPALTVVPFDLEAPIPAPALTETLAGCEAVVHAAARLPAGGALDRPENALTLFRLNTVGTVGLMEAASRLAVPAFVFVSTANLFAPAPDAPIDETTPPTPPDLYALSKLAGESAAALFGRSGATAFASLRISAPYGPGYRTRAVLPLFIERALANHPLTLMGSGGRRQLFTYAEDIATACLACIERRARGVFNIAGPASVSMRDLAGAVLAALPDSTSRIVLTGEPDPNEGRDRRLDLSRARRELGFVPAFDLHAGVRAMVAALVRAEPPPYTVTS